MSDYYGPPASAQNSSMAVISLIAGILGLTLFPVLGSIIAVITGPMAKKEIAASAGTLGGEGLAQAGMILGWIGIGLSVLGVCIGGVLIVVPFCIAFSAGEWSSLFPLLHSLI
ncbi:MAG: DUF4190 domain-containing protein [Chloroflexi bacterium]|jgi:hypothetical protein|nr:DUF4190 domain-containing protein [Chloroflexota bacterium]